MYWVALRKESVDRNLICPMPGIASPVALRKESVDRNVDPDADTLTDDVALRKESVDRNKRLGLLGWLRVLSLSARRAWIEITVVTANDWSSVSRSPQGERG